MTSDRIDRVKFRDLLHDHFDMSDDFFMDRGNILICVSYICGVCCVCSVQGI